MEKAAERNAKEKESRRAMQDASDVSVIKGVVALEKVARSPMPQDPRLSRPIPSSSPDTPELSVAKTPRSSDRPEIPNRSPPPVF